MKITCAKTIYRVVGNTDNTEGRGSSYTLAFCEKEATARRLAKKKGVQGSDAHVEKVEIYQVDGGYQWCGPIIVKKPTEADEAAQTVLDQIASARQKAKDLGLTDEELRLLTAGRRL